MKTGNILVCMLFIFGVLLEFALVNSYMRRANKYNYMAEKMQQSSGGGASAKSRHNDACGNGGLRIVILTNNLVLLHIRCVVIIYNF